MICNMDRAAIFRPYPFWQAEGSRAKLRRGRKIGSLRARMTILNCSSIGLVGADGPSLQDAFPLLETFLAYYYPVGEKGSAFVNARRGTTFGYHYVGNTAVLSGRIAPVERARCP